ncbi:MAG TPA: DUF72 domain-containing protein, partial [Verrucomicrobiae bacterium]|nr:DUF72 domain-containing protein [Verrucomicrobiae bacterium]
MIWIGTSGFQYPEWKGHFYPAKLPNAKMLAYYAGQFPTTEINYTFRQIPADTTINNWIAATPESFWFTLKILQQVTHIKRLRGCEALVGEFAAAARKFGPKLGIILVQLPPNFKKDLAVLGDFLGALPKDLRFTLEFRNESWFADDVYALLRQHKTALCIADSDKIHTPEIATAEFGYFRLRDEGY